MIDSFFYVFFFFSFHFFQLSFLLIYERIRIWDDILIRTDFRLKKVEI